MADPRTEKRLIYVCYYDLAQGDAAFLHIGGVIRGLRNRGWEIHLLSLAPTPPPESWDVAWTPIRAGLLRAWDFDRRAGAIVSQLLRAEHWEVVLVRDYTLALAPLKAAASRGVPTWVEVNGWVPAEQVLPEQSLSARWIEAWDRRRRPRKYALARGVIAVTPAIAREISTHYGVPAERCVFIPNGIGAAALTGPDRLAARIKLALDPDELLVGYVGAMMPWHGVPEMVEGFARVAGQFPHARLVLVGGGLLSDRIQALIRELGLVDRVRWVGKVSPEAATLWIAALDLGLCLLRPEVRDYGWPIKLLSYLGSGVPCLYPSSETFRFLDDKKVGVPTDATVESVAEGLCHLLIDRNALRMMGITGRTLVEKEFTWECIGGKIDNCIQKGGLSNSPARSSKG